MALMTSVEPTAKRHIIILGGGYAGMLAAARIGRSLPKIGSRDWQVTLIEPKAEFTQRIRLHEVMAGRTLKTIHIGESLGRQNVNWCQGKVTQWDADKKQLRVQSVDGKSVDMSYEYLVYALGSHVTELPFQSDQSLPVTRLNSLEAAKSLHQRLVTSAAQQQILVVGAGLTGIESASEIAEAFPQHRVKLIINKNSWNCFSQLGRDHLFATMAKLGVELLQEDSLMVTAIKEQQVYFSDGRAEAFQEIIWCGGFKANELAQQLKLPLDDLGRLPVDEQLRLPSHPEVFVAGDAAAVSQINKATIRMGCAAAMPQGIYVGETIIKTIRKQPIKPFRFAFMMRCISLGRKDALIQFTGYADQPKEKIWQGRRGRWTKEIICRMTLAMIDWELKWGIPLYSWPEPPKSIKESKRNMMVNM